MLTDFITDHRQYSLFTRNAAGEQTSEVRTFIIDRQPHALTKRLHWINAYNTPDSFSFTGWQESRVDYKRTFYKTGLPSGYSDVQSGVRTLNADVRKVITIGTGFIDLATLAWLSYIPQSETVYLEEGGQYLPLLPNDSSLISYDARVSRPVFRSSFFYDF
jgi:hypothetical protein